MLGSLGPANRVADATIHDRSPHAGGNRTDSFIVQIIMKLSLILAAAALVLAACGGSSSTVAGSAGDEAAVADDTGAGSGDNSGSESLAETPAETPADDSEDSPAEEAAADAPAPDESSPSVMTPEEAAAAAEANQPNLQVSDNPIDTEMLVVADIQGPKRKVRVARAAAIDPIDVELPLDAFSGAVDVLFEVRNLEGRDESGDWGFWFEPLIAATPGVDTDRPDLPCPADPGPGASR